MWGKIKVFFKGFLTNAKEDPMSTIKGAGQLAAAGGIAYGMATGIVPVNSLSIGTASSLALSGVHAIGTNTATGTTNPETTKVEEKIQTAVTLAPVALSVVDQVAAMKKDAEDGQKKVEQYQQIATTLASLIPATEKKPE